MDLNRWDEGADTDLMFQFCFPDNIRCGGIGIKWYEVAVKCAKNMNLSCFWTVIVVYPFQSSFFFYVAGWCDVSCQRM